MRPDSPLPEIFLGLGSNVGDRLSRLRTALRLMEQAGIRVLKSSSVYETEPVGPSQRDFLNAVCLVESDLSPDALLVALQEIEGKTGRLRRERWGPREIDLDILLYGDEVVHSATLTIPHPELQKRSFVLVPLMEIAPELVLPGGTRVAALVNGAPTGIRPYREGRLWP